MEVELMDVTMPLLTVRQINDISADISSFADRLSRAKETDDPDYREQFANAEELIQLCDELREKILSLAFQLGDINASEHGNITAA